MDSKILFRAELRVILAVASLHSVALGLWLTLFPNAFLQLMGFPLRADIFYPRQSGVFLFILGLGYGLGARDPHRHWGLVALAILSKGVAILFLFYHVFFEQAPQQIFLAGLGDAAFFILLTIFAWGYYRQ